MTKTNIKFDVDGDGIAQITLGRNALRAGAGLSELVGGLAATTIIERV